MKNKIIGLSLLLFLAAGGAVYAQNVLVLDEAIRNAVEDIEGRLTRGVRVAVLNFRSPSRRFSNYVLDEIMTEMVNNRRVTVVDRASLDIIRGEMDFQMSGEVSDDSAQAIGRMLGAQTVISGHIEDMGGFYRMRLRAIEVETAIIQIQPTYNVRKDSQVAALMGGSSTPIARTPEHSTPSATNPALHPQGLTFSSGQKIGRGFLNMAGGLGSFTMRDWAGGLIVGGLQAAGLVVAPLELEAGNDVAIIGLALYSAGLIYGFIRPFSYDRDLSRKRAANTADNSNPMNNISLIPIPTSKGIGMGVLYRAAW
jgi:TolB-like protein